jgi:uncharacterized protein (DUF302 family)
MTQTMDFHVTLPVDYATALADTRAALKAEGFGVLTEIDLKATFKEKLGQEFRPYTILGACNPPLAHAALTADARIGLLLPCNVTVEAVDDRHALVRLTDPRDMLASAAGGLSPALTAVAEEAHQRMSRVLVALRERPYSAS